MPKYGRESKEKHRKTSTSKAKTQNKTKESKLQEKVLSIPPKNNNVHTRLPIQVKAYRASSTSIEQTQNTKD